VRKLPFTERVPALGEGLQSCSVSNLIRLDVSYNMIIDVFPTALYRCRSLRYLDLSWNGMGGELPDDIGYDLGANLSKLNLEGNNFNGTIPASLSMLRNLRYLGLDRNRFTGSVPVELGELTSLRELWLSYNLLDAGELLASFENLTNLVSLSASNCSLTGDFPSYVVKMSKLERLELSSNSLTGSIPAGV
jgi:Leucine-rich repeat (LRR) protein